METVSNMDNIISTYEDTFEQLREEFGGRIATQTALITADLAAKVNKISKLAFSIALPTTIVANVICRIRSAPRETETRQDGLERTQDMPAEYSIRAYQVDLGLVLR